MKETIKEIYINVLKYRSTIEQNGYTIKTTLPADGYGAGYEVVCDLSIHRIYNDTFYVSDGYR